ncbi:hypothetical protein IP84_16835 [beta proteobacterium AAP99]|nr:hypothetical protein IP84_16835 [beta proteobacterium AAP99]
MNKDFVLKHYPDAIAVKQPDGWLVFANWLGANNLTGKHQKTAAKAWLAAALRIEAGAKSREQA